MGEELGGRHEARLPSRRTQHPQDPDGQGGPPSDETGVVADVPPVVRRRKKPKKPWTV